MSLKLAFLTIVKDKVQKKLQVSSLNGKNATNSSEIYQAVVESQGTFLVMVKHGYELKPIN